MKAFTPALKKRYLSLLSAIHENEPISTSRLAQEIGGDPKKVYRDCHDLEKEELLSSSNEPGRKLLFCLDDREVLTYENYEEHEDHDLRSFFAKVKVWSLSDSGRRFVRSGGPDLGSAH